MFLASNRRKRVGMNLTKRKLLAIQKALVIQLVSDLELASSLGSKGKVKDLKALITSLPALLHEAEVAVRMRDLILNQGFASSAGVYVLKAAERLIREEKAAKKKS